jgi:hypothetical protein
MADHKVLFVSCTAESRVAGAVRLDGRVVRRRVAPGTAEQVMYKVLCNAFFAARRIVASWPAFETVVVRVGSQRIVQEIEGRRRCRDRGLQPLLMRARREREELLEALRRNAGERACVRLEHVAERKEVAR